MYFRVEEGVAIDIYSKMCYKGYSFCTSSNISGREGNMDRTGELLGLMERDQRSSLALLIRNFNHIGSVKAALMTGVETDEIFDRVDLKRILNDEIVRAMMANCPDGVPAQVFIDHGQMIANSLRRPFMLTHQYGSGRQEEAEFDEHEFTPAAA